MRANHERVVRRAGLCPRIAKPRSLWQRQSWIAAALITGFGSLLILGLSQDSSAKEDVLSTLRSIPSATLSDAVDEVAGRRGFMEHYMRPIGLQERMAGRAKTVLYGPCVMVRRRAI